MPVDHNRKPGYFDRRALLGALWPRALRLKKCSCMMTVDFAMSHRVCRRYASQDFEFPHQASRLIDSPQK